MKYSGQGNMIWACVGFRMLILETGSEGDDGRTHTVRQEWLSRTLFNVH